MSSAVNKSGTRFIPKIRQRRAAVSIPTPPSTQVTVASSSQGPPASGAPAGKEASILSSGELSIKLPEGFVDHSKTAGFNETSVQSPPTTQDQFSRSTGTVSLPLPPPPSTNLSRDSTETGIETKLRSPTRPHPSQRSSRLSSLSESIASGTFADTLKLASGTLKKTSTTTGTRLSTISSSTAGVYGNSKNHVSGNHNGDRGDVALNSLKKRKIVASSNTSNKTNSSISATTTTPFKISVASSSSSSSKIAVPTYNNSSDDENDDDSHHHHRKDAIQVKKNEEDGNYTEIYTIKSSSEIPRYIEDKDSARYRVDENAFTLEDLCRPNLPIGELSENYERAKQARLKRMQKRKERRLLRMRARVERKSIKLLTNEDEKEELKGRRKAAEDLLNADVPEPSSSRPQQAIQLKLGVDGSLVVDEESTVVDRHKNASIENSHKVKVDENQFENLYNYGTYGKTTYTEPWTPDELAKFYRALAMWGTDFNLISQLYPYRTRTQIRAKFNSEGKRHPLMIDLALRSKLPPDFEGYCADIGKNIGTIEEFNAKLEALQIEHEKEMQALKEAREKAILEDFNDGTETGEAPSNVGGAQGLSKPSRGKKLRDAASAEVILGTIDDVKRRREEALRLKREEEEQEEEREERKPVVKRESRVRRLRA